MQPDNVMKPLSVHDEGGQVAPATFRAMLAAILPGLSTDATRATASVVSKSAKRQRTR
jgi:hypothetical protein